MKKSHRRLRELHNYLRRSNANRARQELPIIPEFEEMWMKIDAGGDPQSLIAEAEALIVRLHGEKQ